MAIFKTVIYVDILVALNLFVNFFILLAVAKFLYLRHQRWRLVLGALLGAIYSLYIFIPEPILFISFLIKIFMAFTIIIVSFGISKFILLRSLVCFCLISFGFSGLNFAMWIAFRPCGMFVKNGVVYFNISPLVLVTSTLIAYFLIEFMNKFLGKHVCQEAFYRVKVKFKQKLIEFDAQLDTGNSLKEPFSNLPVILVDQEKIVEILPDKINFEDINFVKKISERLNVPVRLIPFSGISENGLLFGFKPDNVIIQTFSGENFEKEAYIAVCERNGLKNALIGSDLVH
ncbi:MAG: sigma-E processing peptidase SpoIIGA [Firmicutes bacterium]|nr:sigma-E processing peptidase SpoIIGA [Bacillota bacterium]